MRYCALSSTWYVVMENTPDIAGHQACVHGSFAAVGICQHRSAVVRLWPWPRAERVQTLHPALRGAGDPDLSARNRLLASAVNPSFLTGLSLWALLAIDGTATATPTARLRLGVDKHLRIEIHLLPSTCVTAADSSRAKAAILCVPQQPPQIFAVRLLTCGDDPGVAHLHNDASSSPARH